MSSFYSRHNCIKISKTTGTSENSYLDTQTQEEMQERKFQEQENNTLSTHLTHETQKMYIYIF